MDHIKAIETRYKGYRFRSRLEARWAVFFDALGLTWEYEPEGFETSAGWYLPDFRFVSNGPEPRTYWAEVKPQQLNEKEREKAFAVSSYTNAILIELNEIPDPHRLSPYQMTYCPVTHYVGAKMKDAQDCFIVRHLMEFYKDNTSHDGSLSDALEWDMGYYRNKHGAEHPLRFLNGMVITGMEFLLGVLDTGRACEAARSARFEHGETP